MRLIDADILHDRLVVTAEKIEKRNETLSTILADLVLDIADAVENPRETPTVDAVPVVRCRDCMWYVIDELKSDETPDRRYKPTFCELHRTWMPSDGFCSEGKEEKR